MFFTFILDINFLLEPRARGPELPASKKSPITKACHTTGATRVYATALSACTQSPSQKLSPAYDSRATACQIYPPNSAHTSHTPTSAPQEPGLMLRGPAPPLKLRLEQKASQNRPLDKSPARKQVKWTPKEDNQVIKLRGEKMRWADIAKQLPGRNPLSCRLRYQNYLEKRVNWDEETKSKLARLYAQLKDQMWQKIATEMSVPWRSAESMHWQLGEQEMSARANGIVFQLHPAGIITGISPLPEAPVRSTFVSHGFPPANASQSMPNPSPMPPQLHQVPPPMFQPPMLQPPMHGYYHQ
ncbi:MYB DNA-binding domain containing protein [Pyrenophora tritici-repentis]|nr:MYB DNA-binding domain containing protein [Pyrenophora tritici-repentis]KAI1564455.1 MYB DNA-binding domain containing protein [Pyrenophora tritici-repentis]